MATLKNTTINDTGHLTVASGTTAQRPAGTTGMLRYNTSTAALEVYTSNGTKWVNVAGPSYTVDALIVAGGGCGGRSMGGGGGAGGFRAITGITVYPGFAYPIIVGSGGTGTSALAPSIFQPATGSNGGDSSAFGYTSLGGGAGGAGRADNAGTVYGTGSTGGSGGGGGNSNAPAGPGGLGTSGQGNNGGNATAGGYFGGRGGGGGGAGAAGSNSGPGGNGSSSAIAQSSPTYAGGGGGAFYFNNAGSPGGTGGGGQGAPFSTAGSVNTGGGGGATYNGRGENGGSGIVWVRYTGTQKGYGGTVTTDATYTYHKFEASNVFIA